MANFICEGYMRNQNVDTITDATLSTFSNVADARLKILMESLVKHLHAFAKDVQLTEAEWTQAIKILTDSGHKCTETRQEFILWSDVLGLSTLVNSINNQKPKGCTESTVFGPFFVERAPHYENGDDISRDAPGARCAVNCRITDLNGVPISGAKVNVWQADEDGFYDVQYENLDYPRARGELKSDDQGRIYFKSIVANAYPIPTDGPVGDMLIACNRHPWRPAHLHFMIEAPGYETLITQVFRDGEEYLDSDAVFGVRESLVTVWEEQSDGGFTLHYDFVLNSSQDK